MTSQRESLKDIYNGSGIAIKGGFCLGILFT